MGKHKIVIVGGGFAGIKVALELVDDERFHVTLVSKLRSFRYYPTLYRTATGGRKMVADIPFEQLFGSKKITILNDEATKIDRLNRRIITKGKVSLNYDALVLALGVRTNYFGIKGLKEYSYGIKSLDDAVRLKNHLHKQLILDHKPDINYVVVGGGATGVELAGVLPSYINNLLKNHGIRPRKIHIDLIEASPRLLPKMPKKVSRRIRKRLVSLGVRVRTNTVVQAQNAEALMVHNKPIRSHTVVWTAGVTNHPFFSKNDFQLANNHKVRVDQFLQAEPAIYVAGDNADTPYSGMAQTALHDGIYLANNFKRLANNQEARPYNAKKPIYVTPVGPGYAAVVWGKIRLFGLPGAILRRVADFRAYKDYLPWQRASELWMAEEDEEESCPYCD